jgi:hypothetical protein
MVGLPVGQRRRCCARNAIRPGAKSPFPVHSRTWRPAPPVAFSIIVGANFAAARVPLSILFALVG